MSNSFTLNPDNYIIPEVAIMDIALEFYLLALAPTNAEEKDIIFQFNKFPKDIDSNEKDAIREFESALIPFKKTAPQELNS